METKNNNTLKVYNWHKISTSNAVNLQKFKRIVPENFSKELIYKQFTATLKGHWKIWKLTHEGEGEFPIFKFEIKNGSFSVKDKDKTKNYSLKDEWIKLGIKINYNEIYGRGIYSIDKKNLKIYNVDSSFGSKYENLIERTLLESLLTSCIKDKVNNLNKFLEEYEVKSEKYDTLSLLGWDIVYSTSYRKINNMIEKQSNFPDIFEHSNRGMNIEGQFDTWSIGAESQGKFINVKCPIFTGSVYLDEDTSFNFKNDSYVCVSLDLDYFKDENNTFYDPTSKNSGTQYDLKVKENNNVLFITDINLPPSVNDEDKILVQMLFLGWFKKNIKRFEQIFYSVLLNDISEEEGFQWLKPTEVSYGCQTYNNNGEMDEDKSVFGVLAMVDGKEPDNTNSYNVDGRLLNAAGGDASFATTTPLFVNKWLVKGLEMMQIEELDEFEMLSNGYGFKNKKKFQFGNFKNEKGYSPAYIDAEKFRYEIINDQLAVSIDDVYWDMGRKITGHVEYRQFFDLELKSGVDASGEKYENVFMPVANVDPVLNVTFTEEGKYFWEEFFGHIVTEIVVGIIAGVAGVYIGKALINTVGKQLVKTTGAKWLLKVTGELAEEIKKSYPKALGTLSRQAEYELMELSLIPERAVIEAIRKAPTEIGSRIWCNTIKFTSAIIASAAGVATIKAITNTIRSYDAKEYSQLQNINSFVESSVGSILWPQNGKFKLKTAKLRGVYLIGGNLEDK
ncbi:TULIP family P47-like protein [Clostridium sp. Marseille-Q2269]|uniref:TULIP family P47-like protein n=1 Tax=Clostridium sp. Marseille-Q2269 TaxID=2942205 RepID=UPI0020749201|nr:TULIP family P47-like protein [Clostridium sp. Marseille-Q2269]